MEGNFRGVNPENINLPLDQSRPTFWASFKSLGGNEEDLRATKMQKLHQILVQFFGGHFYYKIWGILRFLAKMLAAE